MPGNHGKGHAYGHDKDKKGKPGDEDPGLPPIEPPKPPPEPIPPPEPPPETMGGVVPAVQDGLEVCPTCGAVIAGDLPGEPKDPRPTAARRIDDPRYIGPPETIGDERIDPPIVTDPPDDDEPPGDETWPPPPVA